MHLSRLGPRLAKTLATAPLKALFPGDKQCSTVIVEDLVAAGAGVKAGDLGRVEHCVVAPVHANAPPDRRAPLGQRRACAIEDSLFKLRQHQP